MSLPISEADGLWNPAPPDAEEAALAAIYTITCYTTPRERISPRGTLYVVRDSRVWGWFRSFAEAADVVARNVSDIQETTYEIALIERVPEGLHGMPRREWWFRWNLERNAFEPCAKPEDYAGIINHSMG